MSMTDYVSALSIDLGTISPEIALLLAAFVILLAGTVRRLAPAALWAALLAFAVAFWLSARQWGYQSSGFADMVVCDSFGVAFKMIFLTASVISLFLGYRYMKVRHLDRPEYYALMVLSTLGMMVMANTADLVIMFLGLEIMSLPLYIMAGINRRSLESNEAAIKYFIMGAFATAFLLLGIAFVYGAAETTNLRRIVTDFSYIVQHAAVFLYAGVTLIIIGFGFKIGAVPFHSWIPDVYHGAPTPVTAFFSVAPKAAGFAALLRIVVFGFSDIAVLSSVFWVLAVLTMSVGNILALRQDNVKRMLAYSSISHAGYILIALAVGGGDALSVAVFYLVAYMMFNLGAFSVVTVLELRSGCKSDISEYVGLSRVHPYLTATLTLFMLALAGFPPTVGFFGKFYIFAAAVHGGYIWLTVIGVLNSFVSVYYYLRVVRTAWFDTVETPVRPTILTISVVTTLLITAIGTLGLGLFPHELLRFSQVAIFGLP
jgi:NADH-quinone oxidoreductase subunit N